MTCPNCQQETASCFCPDCGQRLDVKRITFKDTVADFWLQVVGFDGYFLRTIRDLTVRPGQVAQSYLSGVRVRYFGPVAYFFFMITLLLLWLGVLDLDFAELIRSKQSSMPSATANSRVSSLLTQWVGDHIKWFLFVAVPFQAVAARFIFFRKSSLNLVEHTVPLFFTGGHLFWITALVFTYRKFAGEIPWVPITAASMAYFGYMYADLMRYQSRLKAFAKGVGVYIGGQALFAISLTLLAVAIIILLSVFSPDTLDAIRPSRN